MIEAFSAAANIGIAAVIGIVLVKAFLGYNKELAKRNETLYTQFTADAAKREEQYREDAERQKKEYKQRENILVAESARREEILRQESERRELLLKQEAAKRGATLINTIEGFSLTMEKISKTMDGRLIFPLPKGLSF